jgi:hypothetical protein
MRIPQGINFVAREIILLNIEIADLDGTIAFSSQEPPADSMPQE